MPNLPASVVGRRSEVIQYRSTVGEEIAKRIRGSLSHGDGGDFDATLKACAKSALLMQLVAAMMKCPKGSPGRTALQDVADDECDRRDGQSEIFPLDAFLALKREVLDVDVAATDALLHPTCTGARETTRAELKQLGRVVEELNNALA